MKSFIDITMNSKMFSIIGVVLWLVAGGLSIKAAALAYQIGVTTDAIEQMYSIKDTQAANAIHVPKPTVVESSPSQTTTNGLSNQPVVAPNVVLP